MKFFPPIAYQEATTMSLTAVCNNKLIKNKNFRPGISKGQKSVKYWSTFWDDFQLRALLTLLKCRGAINRTKCCMFSPKQKEKVFHFPESVLS